jgi:hypothetical protein
MSTIELDILDGAQYVHRPLNNTVYTQKKILHRHPQNIGTNLFSDSTFQFQDLRCFEDGSYRHGPEEKRAKYNHMV